MADYDIEDFLQEQRGRDGAQVLVAVDQELTRIDYKLRGKARARARAAGAEVYRRTLCALGAWVRLGRSLGSFPEEARRTLDAIGDMQTHPR